jgi:phosphatidylinositol alpha 1,6-mannosyltransferase
VILEAGASGLPVVAAAAGGALDLVRAGSTGVLVPPDDAEALAEAILLLAADDELRLQLGAAGRDVALETSWTRSFEELGRAYRAVVATAPAAPAAIAA